RADGRPRYAICGGPEPFSRSEMRFSLCEAFSNCACRISLAGADVRDSATGERFMKAIPPTISPSLRELNRFCLLGNRARRDQKGVPVHFQLGISADGGPFSIR